MIDSRKSLYITNFVWLLLYGSFVIIYMVQISKLEDASTIEDVLIVSIWPLVLLVITIFFEFLIPYNKKWNKIDLQTANSIGYIIINVYPETLARSLSLIVMPFLITKVSLDNINIWPSGLPIAIQVLIGILIYDFIYYWYHRISHKNKFLWKLHRLHHSSEKLNILALYKFNLIDLFLEFFIINSILLLIQIPIDIYLITQGFMIPATLLSHANFDVRLPKIVDWIIINPSSHRYHHSKSNHLIDKNFGGFTLLWDIIFGTYVPSNNDKKIEVGIQNHETSRWIWFQLFDFLKKD